MPPRHATAHRLWIRQFKILVKKQTGTVHYLS